MNYSFLFTKNNLTQQFIDYSNVYLLPSICVLGIFTNIITMIVSYKRNSNENIFKYIFINSTADFLFLLTQSFIAIIRCGVLCPYGYSYWSKFYEIYIYLFVGYIIIAFKVMLDISVSLNRLLLLSNIKPGSKEINFYLKAFLFLIISICLNLAPYVLSREIVIKAFYFNSFNSTEFEILYTKSIKLEFQTTWGRALLASLTIIKDPFLFTSFCTINILLAIKFRKHIKKKKLLTIQNMVKSNLKSFTGF